MSVDKKIKIDTVDGGDPDDHNALKENYFRATRVNDTYQFFTPDGEVIPTVPVVVASGYDFTFCLKGKGMDDISWWITNFVITDENASGKHLKASGNWGNTHKKGDDDGSFQATSGPPQTVEEASSAKA